MTLTPPFAEQGPAGPRPHRGPAADPGLKVEEAPQDDGHRPVGH